MRRLRLLICAVLVLAFTVGATATSQAAVVRRLDLTVANPMPAERFIASGVIGLGSRPVVVQADLGRNRAWVVIARVTSTRLGTFRLTVVSPSRLGALKLRAVGTPARGLPVATPVRTVSVTKPSLTLTAPTTGTVGQTVRMTVVAKPARAGRAVHVQRRRLGTTVWANAAGRREGATGTTPISVPLGAVIGAFEFRAVIAGPTAPVATAVKRITISAVAVPPVPAGPVRIAVALQAAPGPGSPSIGTLGGADTDYVAGSERWDPCRGISYRINVSAVPAGIQSAGAAAISAGLATLSSDSGLQFTLLGETTFAHPATQTFQTPAGRPADTALTIAFVAGDGAQSGESGHAYVHSQSSSPIGPFEIVTADIVLFLGRLLDVNTAGTFDDAALRDTLLHELGHAVGLAHASDQSVMAAIKYGAAFSEYQRGDRAGLLSVGSPQGCWVR
ncbi:MAG: hypothetical protein ABI912_09500 [Actinomycetota bacterium]